MYSKGNYKEEGYEIKIGEGLIIEMEQNMLSMFTLLMAKKLLILNLIIG